MANYFNLTDFNFNLNITSDVYNEALELQNNFYDGNANLDLSRIEKKIFEIRRRLKIMQSAAPESGVDSMKSILLDIRADVYSIVGYQSLMQKFVRYNYRKKYLSYIYVDAFNFKTNYTNWLFTTGQISQGDKDSTTRDLEIDKSIFETYNDLYPSSYVEKFNIGSELWNELKNLYVSTFEIESEGIVSWNSIIKEYVFNFYEEAYNKYMVNNDFINSTGLITIMNPLTQQYNDLINGRDSSIAAVAVSISVLNAEYDDAATTEERKSEITSEIDVLNVTIGTYNTEKTTINEEYNMIIGFYNNYYNIFNTPNSNYLDQFLSDTVSYIRNNFVVDNVWNLDFVRIKTIQYSPFWAALPNNQTVWNPGNPSETEWATDPTSGLLYSSILLTTFEDLETTFKNALPDYVESHASAYLNALVSAKKSAVVKQNTLTKLNEYSALVSAKQAQIDAETDETLIATYQTEFNNLNGVYQGLLEISNDNDTLQSTVSSSYQDIITQTEDVSSETFDWIVKAIKLMNRLDQGQGLGYPSWVEPIHIKYVDRVEPNRYSL